MRATIPRLASVKPARYLEAGTRTGLAGLRVHHSPRSTLLYLYRTTLSKLEAGVPEHSAYRQSVEALTKHRMAIVEARVPPGYEEWAENARAKLEELGNPDSFDVAATADRANGGSATIINRGGQSFIVREIPVEQDMRTQEWDGEPNEGPELEGTRTTEERAEQESMFSRVPLDSPDRVNWEPEPQMTADQIEEIENEIGSGLIEEIIQVAEGELRLADTMVEAKVWESLDEKPAEGQWVYFERKAA